jgi:hypothetical protein
MEGNGEWVSNRITGAPSGVLANKKSTGSPLVTTGAFPRYPNKMRPEGGPVLVLTGQERNRHEGNNAHLILGFAWEGSRPYVVNVTCHPDLR